MEVSASDGQESSSIRIGIVVTDQDEPPGTPAAPSMSIPTDSTTSLRADWTQPLRAGAPSPESYGLRYRHDRQADWTTLSGIRATNLTVTNLTPGTQYEMQVRARNHEGQSEWSPSGTGTNQITTSAAELGTRVQPDIIQPQRRREHHGRREHRESDNGPRQRRGHPDLHTGGSGCSQLSGPGGKWTAPDQGTPEPRGTEQLPSDDQGQRPGEQQHRRRDDHGDGCRRAAPATQHPHDAGPGARQPDRGLEPTAQQRPAPDPGLRPQEPGSRGDRLDQWAAEHHGHPGRGEGAGSGHGVRYPSQGIKRRGRQPLVSKRQRDD